MPSFNRVILMGNLTRDIELRYLPSQMAVADVTLAVNDRRKNANGEWIEEVSFVDVTVWGRTAEVMSEYLSKGSPVFIEGRLKLDTWEQDGQKRSKLKVVCERMQLIGAERPRRPGRTARRRRRARRPARLRNATKIPNTIKHPRPTKPTTRAPPSRPAATIFRFRFCRTDFRIRSRELDGFENPSYHEKAKQSWSTPRRRIEFPIERSACRRDRTAASSCCWCSPSNTWANRATWSR